MNEFELIQRLTRGLPQNSSVVQGSGDDCAVLDAGIPDRWLLFKADAVVEGIHFDKQTKPEQIGHKSLARCLSDVAAMGGTPGSALITIGLPHEFNAVFVEKIYEGMNRLARKYDIAIVGGETTTNPDRLFLSIALIGTVRKERCVLRSGAKVGDALFVTGELGGSLVGKHLDFEPRLKEGLWLAEHFSIHSMIDLSDGLAGDLRHVVRASRVGAELLKSAIPISREAKLREKEGGLNSKPAVVAALTDGEDFELLFSVASGDAVRLLDAWKAEFPELKLSCIGKITEGSGVMLRDDAGVRLMDAGGYVHFS